MAETTATKTAADTRDEEREGPGWVPFLDDVAGDFYCLDTEGTPALQQLEDEGLVRRRAGGGAPRAPPQGGGARVCRGAREGAHGGARRGDRRGWGDGWMRCATCSTKGQPLLTQAQSG